jgi:hypothetical protein
MKTNTTAKSIWIRTVAVMIAASGAAATANAGCYTAVLGGLKLERSCSVETTPVFNPDAGNIDESLK